MRKLIFLLFLIASCNTNDVKIIADSDFDNDGKVFLVQYKENRPVLKDSTYIAILLKRFDDPIEKIAFISSFSLKPIFVRLTINSKFKN